MNKELLEKLDEYVSTFTYGKDVAKTILFDVMRKDYVDYKMRMMRYNNIYEKNAREWYNKHGTQGEY